MRRKSFEEQPPLFQNSCFAIIVACCVYTQGITFFSHCLQIQIQIQRYHETYKTYTTSSTVFFCVFCPTAIHDISKCLVIWLHTSWPPHETASSVGCKVFCLIVEVLKTTLFLRQSQNDDVCDGSGMSPELHRCNVIGCTNAGGEVTTKHQLYYWETNLFILDNDDHLV